MRRGTYLPIIHIPSPRPAQASCDAGMDDRALLNQAFNDAGLTLREFAARGGTSRAAMGEYLAGRRSPTVRTLNRLLAGVGLQVRATLEPLLADLDERVAAMLSGKPVVDVSALRSLASACEREFGRGPLAWAFDGPTALNLHGLAVDAPLPCMVVRFDAAARIWLTRGLMQCTTPATDVGSWSSWTPEEVRASTRGPLVGRYGFLMLRATDELPSTVRLRPPGAAQDFPVVTVDEVERSRPEFSELLARYRATRG
jgi:transcriptional regulator with XRE-family HTH domain